MPQANPYNEDVYIKPGANLQVFVWLVVLGIPALLLFLTFAKNPSEITAGPLFKPQAPQAQNIHHP